MGSLLYGNTGTAIEFDDRALMHLQIVITGKLRRREGFLFSWTDSVALGSGRTSVWLDPSIPLLYRYRGNRVPTINRAWIDAMSISANSGSGLLFTIEPPMRAAEIKPAIDLPIEA
jgi:hypothetical protein